MTKEELLIKIEECSEVYEIWEKKNNELEYLPKFIEDAFSEVKEAVVEYISQIEK